MNIPEDFNFEESSKELKYTFVKHIASETKAQAIHVKVDGINYQIVTTPTNLGDKIYGYESTRTGKVIDYTKSLFVLPGKDYKEGVIKLLEVLEAQQK